MSARVLVALIALALLAGWVTDDVPLPRGLDEAAIDEDCAIGTPAPEARTPRPPSGGRAIGGLDRARCESTLREAGVAFQPVEPGDAPHVEQPIRLAGPLGGVRITPDEGVHAILDCRLAAALAAWAPELRAQGVARIEHVSMYRPNARVRGTGSVSGHAHALAIDALAFVLEDGRRLSVRDAWTARDHGDDPCATHEGDDDATARMRSAICSAVQRDLFQVVLTPHHDAAHADHVHLEVRPGVDWSYVR